MRKLDAFFLSNVAPSTLAAASTAAFLLCGVHPVLGAVATAEPLGASPGWREKLERAGLNLSLHYTGELQSNPIGGVTQGGVVQGLVRGSLDLDLEQALGWSGTRFHVHGYNIHGESLTSEHLNDLNVTSNIDSHDQTRLVELWLEKGWRDDRINLRLGQLALDPEFAVSEPGALFVNSAFGALPTMGLNLTTPIYPQGTPGVRLRLAPIPNAYVQAAVYQGNPGDPAVDGHGSSWRFDRAEGALAIAEVGFTRNADKLPGTFRLGFFNHSGQFTDQGSGTSRRGQQGIYAVAQQRAYPTSEEEGPALDFFSRVSGVFQDGRSTVDFHFDGGAIWTGVWPSRPDDALGLGFAYTRLSDGWRRASVTSPRPDHEAIFELSYQARANECLAIQPDLQYIIHPGGSSAVENALVLGFRIDIEF